MAEKIKLEFEGDFRELRSELLRLNKAAQPKGLPAGANADLKKWIAGMGAAAMATSFASKELENMFGKETKLAEFSAITGVSGKALQEFGLRATELSNSFGTTAVENIESFKGVLSRLGPDFGKSSAAVKGMGENINVLAKASGLDAPTAMDSLTTSMLQFGVDLKDPMAATQEASRMMNVLAAGAKEGAAEVPQVAEAVKIAGISAKMAGVSFEETNAAIQMLATGGLYGAQAGTALRNVFIKLQAPTEEARDLMRSFGIDADKASAILAKDGLNAAVAYLKTGFDNIKTPGDKAALLNKVFGETAQDAAAILMEKSGPAFEELTKKLTGTTVAYDQSNIVMNTNTEKWKRFSAEIDNKAVKSLESAQRGIMRLYDGLKNLNNMNYSTAASSINGFLKDAIDYSTLGLSSSATTFLFGDKTDSEIVDEVKAPIEKSLRAIKPMADAMSKNLMSGAMAMAKTIEDQAKKAAPKQTPPPAARARSATPAKEKKDTFIEEQMNLLADQKIIEDEFFRRLNERLVKIEGSSAKEVEMRVKLKEAIAKVESDLVSESDKIFEEGTERRRAAAKSNIMDVADTLMKGSFAQMEFPDWVNQGEDLDWSGNLKKTDDAMNVLADSTLALGAAFGSAIGGNADAMKEGLKNILLIGLQFAEKKLLLGEAVTFIDALLNPTSLITNIPLMVAAELAIQVARAGIASLAVGTWRVPEDQLAQLHKDEKVIPAPFSRAIDSGQAIIMGRGNGSRVSMTDAPDIMGDASGRGLSGGSTRRSTRTPYEPSQGQRGGQVAISYGSMREAAYLDDVRQSRRSM